MFLNTQQLLGGSLAQLVLKFLHTTPACNMLEVKSKCFIYGYCNEVMKCFKNVCLSVRTVQFSNGAAAIQQNRRQMKRCYCCLLANYDTNQLNNDFKKAKMKAAGRAEQRQMPQGSNSPASTSQSPPLCPPPPLIIHSQNMPFTRHN